MDPSTYISSRAWPWVLTGPHALGIFKISADKEFEGLQRMRSQKAEKEERKTKQTYAAIDTEHSVRNIQIAYKSMLRQKHHIVDCRYIIYNVRYSFRSMMTYVPSKAYVFVMYTTNPWFSISVFVCAYVHKAVLCFVACFSPNCQSLCGVQDRHLKCRKGLALSNQVDYALCLATNF